MNIPKNTDIDTPVDTPAKTKQMLTKGFKNYNTQHQKRETLSADRGQLQSPMAIQDRMDKLIELGRKRQDMNQNSQ